MDAAGNYVAPPSPEARLDLEMREASRPRNAQGVAVYAPDGSTAYAPASAASQGPVNRQRPPPSTTDAPPPEGGGVRHAEAVQGGVDPARSVTVASVQGLSGAAPTDPTADDEWYETALKWSNRAGQFGGELILDYYGLPGGQVSDWTHQGVEAALGKEAASYFNPEKKKK